MTKYYKNSSIGIPEVREKYFNDYVSTNKSRTEKFRSLVTSSGGPSLATLDFSPESLVPLWKWVSPQLKLEKEPINRKENIPLWYGVEDELRYEKLTTKSLILADGMASYFAECLLINIEGTQWKLIPEEEYEFRDQNKPIIYANGEHINPISSTLTAVGRSLLYPDDPINSPQKFIISLKSFEKSING